MDRVNGVPNASRRQGRRWRFSSAVLDEPSWTLEVKGQRVAIEAKPLELLHELLLRAGQVVTKEELLDTVWPGIFVAEASLTTAVMKLRRALGDEKRGGGIIETVPRMGYRLAVPVEVEPKDGPSRLPPETLLTHESLRTTRRFISAGMLGVVLFAAAIAATRALTASTARTAPVSRVEVEDALRKLDSTTIRDLLMRGWKPSAPIDWANDTPLGLTLEICEWNPAHDRQQLMQVVRLLLDNGARPDQRNTFGDTPYSIAKAKRYCGPDHPVTRMLHTVCYNGANAPQDKCLATYALRRQ